jgi:IPT/TIG domain
MSVKSIIGQWAAGAVILLFAIGALGAPFALSVWLLKAGATMELQLPLLAIAGVSVLLVSLALVSVSFATFGLSDKTQALGLPEGSIRAVIALALIVLFAIVAFSLYGDLSKPLPAGTERDRSAVDFAKQLLTLVGTLVTAVASFYFGAKTATSAEAADTPKSAPSLRSIDPPSHALANGLTLNLKIAGDNLDLVKEAKIVKGTEQIVAIKVHSNASEVTCELPLLANSVGVWDVVVTDGMGRVAKLPGALTIA